MKVVNTTLQVGTYVLKSQSGSAGDKKIRVDTETGELLVGGLRFPYVSTNRLSFNPDGLIRFKDSEIQVTVGNLWMTTNVVRLESFPNLNPGSQVMLSIEYGNQSAIISNAAKQSILLRYLPATPVFITAVNYSTGAVGRSTLNPVPGGAYQIEASSSSTQTGALETFCVRYDYDYENVPTINDVAWNKLYGGRGTMVAADSEQHVLDAYQRNYLDFVMGRPGSLFGEDAKVMQARTQGLTASPVKLFRSKDAGGTDIVFNYATNKTTDMIVQSGVPFVAPATGTYTLWSDTGFDVTPQYNDDSYGSFLWQGFHDAGAPGVTARQFQLTADQEYVINFFLIPQEPEVDTDNPTGSGTSWGGFISVTPVYSLRQQVKGPLTKICTLQQTVDTRQTTYAVNLTVTPLN